LPVTIIGEGAFNGMNGSSGAPNITSVTFAPETQVVSIEADAFKFTAIANITIPASVKNIGSVAFGGCSSLTSLTFANDSQLETIGATAFSGSKITKIIIPASVTSIGQQAFRGCTELTAVIFEDGSLVQKLDDQVFQGCTKLVSIVIPASATISNHYSVFDQCTALTTVYYGGTDSSEWNTFATGHENLESATVYYYYENENEVPDDSGNYWHWVGNNPTVWVIE